MKASKLTSAALGALLALAFGAGPAAAAPVARAAATCSDYDNQAEAQRNADTRDADGDGMYCETLPCPCARGGSGDSGGSDDNEAAERRAAERRAAARRKAAARRRAARRRAAARRRREEARRRAVENREWDVYDVVDGDTIKIEAGAKRETVRLIGIDTPETRKPNSPVECGGPDATSHMLRLTFPAPSDTDGDGLFDSENAPTGVGVSVATDRTQDLRDNFNRLLVYVRADENLPGDRTAPYDLGRQMLLAGWATVYVFDDPFRRLGSYDDAEIDAQDANAGVYAKCGGDFHQPVE